MAIERQWQRMGQVTTGGLVALTKGVRACSVGGPGTSIVVAVSRSVAPTSTPTLRALFYSCATIRQNRVARTTARHLHETEGVGVTEKVSDLFEQDSAGRASLH